LSSSHSFIFLFSSTERFPLPASLSHSVNTEPPNRSRLFSGEGGAEKNLSLSLSLFQLFLSPHTFSLSLYCPLVLSLSHPPFPYIFFHCPTSSALCTVYLCQSLNVCVLVYIYIWFRSLPQTKLDTKIRISYACLC